MKSELTFEESINWEWFNHHNGTDEVKDDLWLGRIMEHARRNGYTGAISKAAAIEILNAHIVRD